MNADKTNKKRVAAKKHKRRKLVLCFLCLFVANACSDSIRVDPRSSAANKTKGLTMILLAKDQT